MLALYSPWARGQNYAIVFGDKTLNVEVNERMQVAFTSALSEQAIKDFYYTLNTSEYLPLVNALLLFKKQTQLDDWFYYQLIRKTAESISPKKDNYNRYTLYKWFLMMKSGYDARLAAGNNRLIFNIYNNEDISDIPFFMYNHKKYICLNYHDYGKIDFEKDKVFPVNIIDEKARKPFAYKVSRIPEFKPENYTYKDIEFKYKHKAYHFKIKLSKELEGMFINYPGVAFESYFNIPLSHETYHSLIPLLKKSLKGMNQKKGVDYLMRFTRYAFLYEDDDEHFGREKRLSPEQTLFYDQSDCDDRAALFFYLVKEIYNLPMIALLYPTHITMAVQFDKPIGEPIVYKGKRYSVCEPTPQKQNLKIGQLGSSYKNLPFQVVYEYAP
jgi:hypothetical protein